MRKRNGTGTGNGLGFVYRDVLTFGIIRQMEHLRAPLDKIENFGDNVRHMPTQQLEWIYNYQKLFAALKGGNRA